MFARSQPEKKRNKEEREIYNNMRCFARFHSEVSCRRLPCLSLILASCLQEEHEAFVAGLISTLCSIHGFVAQWLLCAVL
mgnify:CR=1 FL=1